MAPIFQDCLSSKHLISITSGLYLPHILRSHTIGTVQDSKMAEKHHLSTLNTTHVHMNASILARVSPRDPRSLAAHGVNSGHMTTSTNTMQICEHACVRIAIVTSLEFPPLPPYRENVLSSYSESTIFQDISAINMSPNLIPQIDNQRNDQPNATVTDTDFVVAHTSTISSNPSSDACEMPMPPTPLMNTIQLPPVVEDEIEIVDVTNINTLSLQCIPTHVDIRGVRLEALEASPSLENLSDFVDRPSTHSDSGSTSTPWREGSLGLIFEGGFSHIFETRASEISESY